MTTSHSDAERRHALNAARMAVERIQALAATTPAANAPTAPYAHHKAKEPQVDGDGPHGRKTNAQNGPAFTWRN